MAVTCDSYGFFNGIMPINQTNWSNYWRGLVPDCVVAGLGGECKPFAQSDGMVVHVSTGQAMVDNHRAFVASQKNLTIAAADDEYSRIDLVVFRVVYGASGASKIVLDVLTGTPSYSPTAPTVTQTTGSTYEYAIAQVTVAANVVTITADAVADLRNVFDGSGASGENYINGSTETLTQGMLVELAGAGRKVTPAREGKIPMGVVTSDNIPPNQQVKVQTVSGREAAIKCTSVKVNAGDALVPSGTAGLAMCGAGWAGGIALESKAGGVIGNVRSLLCFYSKLPRLNTWWLVGSIQESNVIAAYCFKKSLDETSALVNVNDGTEYGLIKSANSVAWNYDKGFFIPATTQTAAGLQSSSLNALGSSILSMAVLYSDLDTGTNTGACLANPVPRTRCLSAKEIHNRYDSQTYRKEPGYRNTDAYLNYGGGTLTAGLVGANYGTGALYVEGAPVTATTEGSDSNINACWSSAMTLGTAYSSTSQINNGSFYIAAAVFYSVELTAAQHLELYENMSLI